jgi:hypothetical protein
MPWDDDKNDGQRQASRDYLETALLEAITVIRDAIHEARSTRNSFLFEEYVRFLNSLAGDLTNLSAVLLAIEAGKRLPKSTRPPAALRVR